MKQLVLAEKPGVAREIARVLKCGQKNRGYIEGANHVITWALGHLVTLAEPEEYDQKLKQWRLEDLPMLPERMKLIVMKQTSQQYRVVRDLMKRADIGEMVIATDAGREGELVARWIMEKAGWKKPVKRLWISSQTDAAIRDGFAHLKPGREYINLYHAAVCRAEADWLIGLNVTRALSCKFNAQLTAGRVQTPTLAMMVSRENEIRNFKPVDYWTIRAQFTDYFGDWRDKKGQSRIFDQARAQALVESLKGQSGVVEEVKTVAKSEPHPLAYDLTELQRDANRRLNFSAQKTLAVLQDLYERHKLVTYPRTDSRYISSDIVPTLPTRLKAMSAGPYAGMVKPLLGQRLTPGKRFVDNARVSDHHAIIPTEQPLKLEALDVDEKRLYDLIARRFIAVLYPPYLYDQTTIITRVGGEHFYSRGRVVKDMGWRTVTTRTPDGEENDDEKMPEQNLSRHNQGEKQPVIGLKLNRSQTKPPARYTEATLLTAMEGAGKFIEDEELRESIKGSGLGTPATRADIIEKLLNNFYIERNGKSLVPTDKGIQLVALAPEELRSPELTARWEQRLTDIARGQGARGEFMAGIRKTTVDMVAGVVAATEEYKPTNVTRSKCPACGKNMLLVKGKQGRMLVCPDRSCGHRQSEKPGDNDLFKKDRVNRNLMRKYSDNQDMGQNLGDVLKAALEEKQKDNKGK
jgi:DNA topoisomerase-3